MKINAMAVSNNIVGKPEMFQNKIGGPFGNLKPMVQENLRMKQIAVKGIDGGPLSRWTSKKEIKDLKTSIKMTKEYMPPILNERTGHILGKAPVLFVLDAMGYEHVFVIILNMSLEEERALNIALQP